MLSNLILLQLIGHRPLSYTNSFTQEPCHIGKTISCIITCDSTTQRDGPQEVP